MRISQCITKTRIKRLKSNNKFNFFFGGKSRYPAPNNRVPRVIGIHLRGWHLTSPSSTDKCRNC